MPDPFGALTPDELGLTQLPSPTGPMAPPPTLQSFLPKPTMADKIAPLAVLATALLAGKSGNGLAQGFAQGQHQQQQGDLQKAQLFQQDALRQQQMSQQVQLRQQAEEDQRQKILLGATQSIKNHLSTITDKSTYDQQVEGYAAQLQQAGFRVTSNALRVQAPFVAPSAKTIARDAVTAWLKNPANAQALKKDPTIVGKAMIQIDTNGDGIPENVPLMRAGALGGIQFAADETGAPIPIDAADPKAGSAFQEVYKAKLARFVADNKRTPDPKEKEKLVNDSVKGAAEQQRAPQEETDPVRVASTAQAILEHRMAPSQLSLGGGSMGKSPFRQAVVAEVNRQNPTFNWQAAEANYQYGKNTGTQTTVRYLDQIEKTLPVLEQASADFARSGIRVINKAILATKSQFGATDVTKFEFARNILADEIAKVLQGGGTGNGTSDAKLHQAQELLSGDMTPAQLSTAIATARELMKSRRATLTQGTFMENGSPPDAKASAAAKLGKR